MVVTAGTGSGKTESFLLPVLGSLLAESATWSGRPAPQRPVVARHRRTVRLAARRRDGPPQGRPGPDPLPDERPRRRPAHAHAAGARQRRRPRLARRQPPGPPLLLRPLHRRDAGHRAAARPRPRVERLRDDTLRRPSSAARAPPRSPPRPATTTCATSCRASTVQRCARAGTWSDAPPDVLVTNYSMLNVMLLRDRDSHFFDSTRAWLDARPVAPLHARRRRAAHVPRYGGHRGRLPPPEPQAAARA